jgi:RimJ/RimL family protein N-acetyltransferase
MDATAGGDFAFEPPRLAGNLRQQLSRTGLQAGLAEHWRAGFQTGVRFTMNLHLRDITNDDLPLIGQWLRAEHVRSTWGDADANIRLLAEPPAQGSWRAVIEADGRKVGLVLWQHPTRAELDVAGLGDIPASVIDIDILIGEADAVGRGLGSSAMRIVAERALSDPAVPFVIACVRPDNLASRRACAKAGFHEERVFDDVPNGPHLLLVRRRRQAPIE